MTPHSCLNNKYAVQLTYMVCACHKSSPNRLDRCRTTVRKYIFSMQNPVRIYEHGAKINAGVTSFHGGDISYLLRLATLILSFSAMQRAVSCDAIRASSIAYSKQKIGKRFKNYTANTIVKSTSTEH